MAKTCKYEKYQKYISYNAGETWMIVQNEYQRGKLLSSTSSDCGGGGITEYRWTNLDPATDYYCSGTTKFYKQQKQQSTDGQTWTDVSPAEYQWGAAYQFNSTDCGYVPPMYKWVLADISSDWVCDECDAEQHRWHATSAYCVNSDKWEHQVKQYKSGSTWVDVTPAQTQEILVEHNSSYCTTPPHDYSQDYLTFVAQDSDVTFWTKEAVGSDKRYSYSLDNGATWTELPTYSGFTVSANHKVMWKGDTSANTNTTYFASSGGTWIAEGNAMSLLYGDDFSGQTSMGNGNFAELFEDCSGLTSAENLILPATAMTGDYGYRYMFQGCKNLTTAPQLPATTLASRCYAFMFYGCTSLRKAPVLSATTLVEECYGWMFYGCTNLNIITCLATDISAYDCTYNWVYGVPSGGTFTKAASMNDWARGDDGIPSGWTVTNYTN